MKRFIFLLMVLAISFSVFAGNNSGNFSLSRVFSEAGQTKITGDPKITFKKKFVVPPGEYIQLFRVAANTETSQLLFVWEEGSNPSLIQGKFLNAQGKTVGKEFNLATTNGFFNVAYNPLSKEFLLVYDNLFDHTQGGSSIFLQRISDAGKLIGHSIEFAKISISTAGSSNFSPKVVFNPISGGYTLVWNRDDGLVGQLLSPLGEADGPVVIIHQTNALYFPPFDLEYLPSGKKLLVTYFVGNLVEDSGDIYLGRLDPMLKKKSNLKKLNTAPVVRAAGWDVSLAFLPDQTGVVFFGDNDGTKRQPINVKGKLSGSSVLAFNAPNSPQNAIKGGASVTFATNAKGTFGLLIGGGSSNGSSVTWAQVLDSKGLPVGQPVAGPYAIFAIIYPVPAKPADTAFKFLYFGQQLITKNGIVEVKLKVTVP